MESTSHERRGDDQDDRSWPGRSSILRDLASFTFVVTVSLSGWAMAGKFAAERQDAEGRWRSTTLGLQDRIRGLEAEDGRRMAETGSLLRELTALRVAQGSSELPTAQVRTALDETAPDPAAPGRAADGSAAVPDGSLPGPGGDLPEVLATGPTTAEAGAMPHALMPPPPKPRESLAESALAAAKASHGNLPRFATDRSLGLYRAKVYSITSSDDLQAIR
jgi:hypothetical protein